MSDIPSVGRASSGLAHAKNMAMDHGNRIKVFEIVSQLNDSAFTSQRKL